MGETHRKLTFDIRRRSLGPVMVRCALTTPVQAVERGWAHTHEHRCPGAPQHTDAVSQKIQ